MWTLVEPDNNPDGSHDKNPDATLASRLPDFDDPVSAPALVAADKRKHSVWRLLACTLMSLLLAMALVAQVSYRHLHSISQHETLRPWLLTFCDYAQCELPLPQNSGMIVSTRLAMEPHPLFQDITQMTLSFTNTAGFAQALPLIELVFTDTQGRNIAGRRFAAGQYLPQSPSAPGSLAHPKIAMAAGENISLQLAFASPSADAANYQVRFVHE